MKLLQFILNEKEQAGDGLMTPATNNTLPGTAFLFVSTPETMTSPDTAGERSLVKTNQKADYEIPLR